MRMTRKFTLEATLTTTIEANSWHEAWEKAQALFESKTDGKTLPPIVKINEVTIVHEGPWEEVEE